MGTKHGPGEPTGAKGLAAGSGDTGMGTPSPQPSWAVAMYGPGLAAMPGSRAQVVVPLPAPGRLSQPCCRGCSGEKSQALRASSGLWFMGSSVPG